jgi:shikimate kinase
MKKVYLVGIMGSGKTYWGRLLALEMDLPFVDLDEFITLQEGISVAAIFEQQGEAHFRQLETAALKGAALDVPAIIACGGGTPCFHDNMEFMLSQGMVVWLHPDVDVVVERVWKTRNKRPLIAAADTREEVAAIISSIVEKRTQWYEQAHITLTSTTIDLHELKAKIEAFEKQSQKP